MTGQYEVSGSARQSASEDPLRAASAGTAIVTTAAAPLVSVVIPTFQRARLAERAVESALGQSYANIEVVVVDDGSTDGTADRLEKFRASGVRVLRNPENSGAAAARNHGIANSRGEFVAFLDSDDVWEAGKLEAQIARFLGGPAALGVVYGGRRTLLPDGTATETRAKLRGDIFERLRLRNPIALCTVVVRRSVLRDVGLFDTTLPACEDWDLLLRIAQKRHTFDFTDDLSLVVDATASGRVSDRRRAVFLANHIIFRRFNRPRPTREALAAHLAVQSRELFHMERFDLAARYAVRSLWLRFDRGEKLALRTLRALMLRRRSGRILVAAHAGLKQAAARLKRPAERTG